MIGYDQDLSKNLKKFKMDIFLEVILLTEPGTESKLNLIIPGGLGLLISLIMGINNDKADEVIPLQFLATIVMALIITFIYPEGNPFLVLLGGVLGMLLTIASISDNEPKQENQKVYRVMSLNKKTRNKKFKF